MKSKHLPNKFFDREKLSSDLTAGLTTALVTIPDGMASAILAGVSPVHGLYALMVGTPVASLTTSAQLMYVANTGALAVAVGSALSGVTPEGQAAALVMLCVLVGAIQLTFGLLKLGGILRFISNAVLTGFMSGIALIIILGQLGEFAGFHSHYSNKVMQAVDLVLHLNQVNWQALVVGLAAFALIIVLGRTRLARFNMVLAMVGALLLVQAFGWNQVALVANVAQIPSSFPRPALPDLRLIPGLIAPALAVALIGLVQSAGVSKSVPNPDGRYSRVSRDFSGQGIANLVSGLFRGMPIGGTMSETSINISAGARSRWAGVFSGLFIIAIVLVFRPIVERFPMPAIAALLIVAGYEALDFEEILDVWDIGIGPRLIMLITFVATLALPVQYAVLTGVVLSALQYLYNASLNIQLVQIMIQADNSLEEHPAPERLPSDEITTLRYYGSSFFASMDTLERNLPHIGNARRPVVVLNLRGRASIGSTFVRVLERYNQRLHAAQGKLMLAGVHPQVMAQLEITETTDDIPVEDIFLATPRIGASTEAALAAAREWLDQASEKHAQAAVGNETEEG